MARLPTVGGDDGNWGTVLNTYLETEHNTDGTHKMGSGLVTENVNTVSSSTSSYTIPSPASYTIHDITFDATCTVTMPTATAGQSFTVLCRQDGTGGRTVTFSGVLWEAGVTPTLTSTASALDVIVFICVDGSNWMGFVSGLDMQ